MSLRLSVQVLVSPPANPTLRGDPMADTPMKSEHPPHNDLHWAMSFVREDLQDVKQDIRDLRGEIRHSMVVTMGYTTILMGLLAAFLQYRLPPG